MEHQAIHPHEFNLVSCESSSSCSTWLKAPTLPPTATATATAITITTQPQGEHNEQGQERVDYTTGTNLVRVALAKHFVVYNAATNKTEQTRAIRKVMCDPVLSTTRFVTEITQQNCDTAKSEISYIVVSNRIVREKISHCLSMMKAKRNRRAARRRRRGLSSTGSSITASTSSKYYHSDSTNASMCIDLTSESSDDPTNNADAAPAGATITATQHQHNSPMIVSASVAPADSPQEMSSSVGGLELLLQQALSLEQQGHQEIQSRPLVRNDPMETTATTAAVDTTSPPGLQSFALPLPPALMASLAQSNSATPVDATPFTDAREVVQGLAATSRCVGKRAESTLNLRPLLPRPSKAPKVQGQQQQRHHTKLPHKMPVNHTTTTTTTTTSKQSGQALHVYGTDAAHMMLDHMPTSTATSLKTVNGGAHRTTASLQPMDGDARRQEVVRERHLLQQYPPELMQQQQQIRINYHAIQQGAPSSFEQQQTQQHDHSMRYDSNTSDIQQTQPSWQYYQQNTTQLTAGDGTTGHHPFYPNWGVNVSFQQWQQRQQEQQQQGQQHALGKQTQHAPWQRNQFANEQL